MGVGRFGDEAEALEGFLVGGEQRRPLVGGMSEGRVDVGKVGGRGGVDGRRNRGDGMEARVDDSGVGVEWAGAGGRLKGSSLCKRMGGVEDSAVGSAAGGGRDDVVVVGPGVGG